MKASRLYGIVLAGLLGSTVVAWSTSSNAQYGQDPDVDTRFYVAPMVSYSTFDEDTFDPDATTGGHVSLGKTFVKQVAMELYAFHYSGIDFQNVPGAEGETTGFGFNLLLFPVRDIFPVFGLIGIGEGGMEADGGFDEDTEFVDLGVGFLYPLTDWINVRGEYRYRGGDVHYPTGGELEVRSDVVSLGVQIPFGAK